MRMTLSDEKIQRLNDADFNLSRIIFKPLEQYTRLQVARKKFRDPF